MGGNNSRHTTPPPDWDNRLRAKPNSSRAEGVRMSQQPATKSFSSMNSVASQPSSRQNTNYHTTQRRNDVSTPLFPPPQQQMRLSQKKTQSPLHNSHNPQHKSHVPQQQQQQQQQLSYALPKQTRLLQVSPEETVKPKELPKRKLTQTEVVEAIERALQSYTGMKVPLETIDSLYRSEQKEGIPYAALGFANLTSFLRSRCDFLSLTDDGQTEILIKPPTYQEAMKQSDLSTSDLGLAYNKTHVSTLVRDECSPVELQRIKNLVETEGANGITIQELNIRHQAKHSCGIDFKGFTRAGFFYGLNDIVEVRENSSGIKLYPRNRASASIHQPAHNLPQKSCDAGKDQQQNAARSRKSRQQNSQQPPQQQQHGKQQSTREASRDSNPPQMSAYYEKELRRVIQQCKRAEGVTFAEFKQAFQASSTLKFDSHGQSDSVFFRNLPHIFLLIQTKRGERLMPAPLRTGIARSNLGNFRSASVLNTEKSRENCFRSSTSLAQVNNCTMRMLDNGSCLWIVSIGNYEYVPTGCVAQLANMENDTVIEDLRKHSLEFRHIRKLDDENVRKALVQAKVARSNEIVTAIPLKAVPVILKAFLGSNVDESFINNLIEVSKAHIRNRSYSRRR